MAEKDIAEKSLEEYNDVFADIVNVLLFDGKPLVKEDSLTDASRLSQYKVDGKLHEQERDVAKFWQNDGSIRSLPAAANEFGQSQTRLCLYGLENQTVVDNGIPLRVISYDGAGYRMQLLADGEKNGDGKPKGKPPRYPVVTLGAMEKSKAIRGGMNMYDVITEAWNDWRSNGWNEGHDSGWNEGRNLILALAQRLLDPDVPTTCAVPLLTKPTCSS